MILDREALFNLQRETGQVRLRGLRRIYLP